MITPGEGITDIRVAEVWGRLHAMYSPFLYWLISFNHVNMIFINFLAVVSPVTEIITLAVFTQTDVLMHTHTRTHTHTHTYTYTHHIIIITTPHFHFTQLTLTVTHYGREHDFSQDEILFLSYNLDLLLTLSH